MREGEAGDGIRTHDSHVGNVVLYQLSYTRGCGFQGAEKALFRGRRQPRDYRGGPCRRKVTL